MKYHRITLCVPLLAGLLLGVIQAPSTSGQEGPPAVKRPRTGSGGPPAVPVKYLTSDHSVIAAAQDIATVNEKSRCNMRYLSLYNIPVEDRVKYVQTLNFLINSLSRARLIKHVYVVPGTENSLLRLDMTDYQFYDEDKDKYIGWDPKVWDQLGEKDVYFSSVKIKIDQEFVTEKIRKTRQVPTGKKVYVANGYGGYYVKDEVITESYDEEITKPTGKTKETCIRDVAPWVNAKAYADLQTATQSKYPIMRGDFFNSLASLPPFYYDFLGFGNKVDDFLAAVVLSKDDIRRAQLEIKGVVVRSGAGMEGKVIPVSGNNRFISRTQGPYGYVWRTKDVKTVDDENDYLRRLKDNKFDASEWIAVGRNGLQWYFLSNNKDERQDEAPIDIVKDNTNEDRRVRNGRSCITCHLRGINEFHPLPQKMVSHAIDVVSPDPKAAKKLREQFIGNLHEFYDDDNKIYAKSITACTTVYVGGEKYNIDTERNANQFGALYNAYSETPIDLQRAAFECGVPVKDLMVILAGARNDPYLLGLSRNEPLFAVPRVHWERSYQQAMLLVLEARGAKK